MLRNQAEEKNLNGPTLSTQAQKAVVRRSQVTQTPTTKFSSSSSFLPSSSPVGWGVCSTSHPRTRTERVAVTSKVACHQAEGKTARPSRQLLSSPQRTLPPLSLPKHVPRPHLAAEGQHFRACWRKQCQKFGEQSERQLCYSWNSCRLLSVYYGTRLQLST